MIDEVIEGVDETDEVSVVVEDTEVVGDVVDVIEDVTEVVDETEEVSVVVEDTEVVGDDVDV